MQASRYRLSLALLLFSSYFTFSSCLSTADASLIAGRQLLALRKNAELPDDYEHAVEANETFANSRLRRAYIALQAWKMAMYSDPLNMTGNWAGPSVCEYDGVENEVIFMNNDLSGCLPLQIGMLGNATVLDVASNSLVGTLPKSFQGLSAMEQLDISGNKMTGFVPGGLCRSPKLMNFTFSNNYFNGGDQACEPPSRRGIFLDDKHNCLPGMPRQRPAKTCALVVSKPVDCSKSRCGGPSPSLNPKPPASAPSPPKHKVHLPPSPKSPPPKLTPPPPVQSPPPSIQSPPPPAHSPPPPVHSPPPPAPIHSPPPPVVLSPPPAPAVHSPPPPIKFPPPPVQSPTPPVLSPPRPVNSPPPPPTQTIILPPEIGYRYPSPPPPVFPGY